MIDDTLFFHVDLDAFYAAVEVLDNPQYKGKAVIVGGKGRRSVVSTCSYEARALNIHSAMPMYKAKRCAPHAIFLTCRMARYKEVSKTVMALLKSFTPYFQQISIDEAFLDMSGMERLFGAPYALAQKIKDEVLNKTGLTVSIGGGANKYIAKMASAISKPDGLLIVRKGGEEEFMRTLPLQKVWGIGEKSLEKLKNENIESIDDLLKFREDALQHMFGSSFGSFLYKVVRGGSQEMFQIRKESKSISSEHTLEFDEADLNKIDDLLFKEADEIAKQLIMQDLSANSVFVKICYGDFSKQQHSQKIESCANMQSLYRCAKAMFKKIYKGMPIRLLGLGVSGLKKQKDVFYQGNLFSTEHLEKKTKAERTIRLLQKKYGGISSLRLLKKDE